MSDDFLCSQRNPSPLSLLSLSSRPPIQTSHLKNGLVQPWGRRGSFWFAFLALSCFRASFFCSCSLLLIYKMEDKTDQHFSRHHQQQQSSQSPPSKQARLSSSDGLVTMASPSPLVLGLGLGVGNTGSEPPLKPTFTFLQLQELQHQALIYKYIVSGVPVPLHLVLPIWKSVAAAAASSPSYFFPLQYPSFMMGCGGVCLDYGNSMEAEPGRCRRTDGKKWRCSREVVPDQKYCERHMHRGRNRSRKPVETGTSTNHPGGGGVAPAGGDDFCTSTEANSGATTQLSISIPSTASSTVGHNSTERSSNNISNNGIVSPLGFSFSPISVLQSTISTRTGSS